MRQTIDQCLSGWMSHTVMLSGRDGCATSHVCQVGIVHSLANCTFWRDQNTVPNNFRILGLRVGSDMRISLIRIRIRGDVDNPNPNPNPTTSWPIQSESESDRIGSDSDSDYRIRPAALFENIIY